MHVVRRARVAARPEQPDRARLLQLGVQAGQLGVEQAVIVAELTDRSSGGLTAICSICYARRDSNFVPVARTSAGMFTRLLGWRSRAGTASLS